MKSKQILVVYKGGKQAELVGNYQWASTTHRIHFDNKLANSKLEMDMGTIVSIIVLGITVSLEDKKIDIQVLEEHYRDPPPCLELNIGAKKAPIKKAQAIFAFPPGQF